MDLKTTLHAAVAHHRAGRLAEAERLYRSIADGTPGIGNDEKYFIDATHNLGLIAAAAGRMDEALALLDRSVELRPRDESFRKNLAATLVNAARPQDAERAYVASKRALEGAPADSAALEMYALATTRAGHMAEAASAWQRLALVRPKDPTIHFNIGTCLQRAAQNFAAADAYREAIRLQPGYVEAISNLVTILGLLDDKTEAWHLARQLDTAGKLADALKPLYATLLIERGQVAKGLGLLEEVERAHAADGNKASQGSQDTTWMRYLAVAKGDIGHAEESMAMFRRFCAAHPDDTGAYAGLLSTSQYLYPDDPPALLTLHRQFEVVVGSKVAPLAPVKMRPLDGRRLRVGYVSGDFRIHSAGFFIEPLLLNHDSSRVEIHCFNTSSTADAISTRLKAKADHWHEVRTMSDEELAALIRILAIDVLVDLSGHTSGSRLTMFASRPAPVQLTYLGYSSTTGLAAIDGFITDGVADPPGESDSHFTERLLRLPHVFAVFRPVPGLPDVAPPPFRETSRVTLGSVATPKKINDAVLDAWTAGLRAAPESQLLLIGKGFQDAVMQQPLLERFAARGIEADRIAVLGHVPFARYVELHGAIDLMLDTFPFSGHTTTVQNLWMGVPVVTYAGQSHRSRMTASVLTSIGLTDFIAHQEADYGPLIARWANDPEALIAHRASLRGRMQASPLMDEPRFARDFEGLLFRAYETKLASGHV
jgi:protein O-GlcNAc transferase